MISGAGWIPSSVPGIMDLQNVRGKFCELRKERSRLWGRYRESYRPW